MSSKSITVVCINGRETEFKSDQFALLHTKRALRGSRALLLSPKKPVDLLDGIEHRTIQRLSYLEWQIFSIYNLYHFIETDYALIVQSDGFVLNPDAWTDEFLNYDYVGAPVHFARVSHKNDSGYLSGFRWTAFLTYPEVKIDLVLNSGFCLRSKKFLETPSQLKLPYNITTPEPKEDKNFTMYWRDYSPNDDVQLCLHMRNDLEKAGLSYAPLSIAKKFAIEHIAPVHDNSKITKIFGQHSNLRSITSLDPVTVKYRVNEKEALKTYKENELIDAFLNLGYKVVFEQ